MIDMVDQKLDDFHAEIITSGRIPYEVCLLRAIDAVRQGIVASEDGGVGALLGLYAILPRKIQEELQSDGLEEEINKHLSLRITIKRVIRKEKRYVPPPTHLEPKVVNGVVIGGMGSEVTVQDGKGRTVFVPVANYKLSKEYWTTRAAQRDFTYRSLRKVINLLDSAGILWRTRTELVGSD